MQNPISSLTRRPHAHWLFSALLVACFPVGKVSDRWHRHEHEKRWSQPLGATTRHSTCQGIEYPSSSNSAFTLIELLVVMTIIGILAELLFLTLGRAQTAARSIACVCNLRQLNLAWSLSNDDHADTMPPNEDNFTRGAWRSLPGSWVVGNAQEDQNSTNIESGVMFPYSQSLPIYHCPADHSKFKGAAGLLRHRSYMLSIYMNSVPFNSRVKNKSMQVSNPATAFVLIDASEWTINDGVFNLSFIDIPPNWYDSPSDRHGQGAN